MMPTGASQGPFRWDMQEVGVAIPASQNPRSDPSMPAPPLGAAARTGRPGPETAPDPTTLGAIRLTVTERAFLDTALTDMTQRERDVVYALCEGGTNEEMARRLSIALPTLRTHLMRLNQKLRTSSKSDVIRHIASVLLEGYRTERIQSDRL
jgi:DNA-binding CsgD family transcriptional regulator